MQLHCSLVYLLREQNTQNDGEPGKCYHFLKALDSRSLINCVTSRTMQNKTPVPKSLNHRDTGRLLTE